MRIAIRVFSGQYVGVDPTAKRLLTANRSIVGEWELFTVESLGDGKIALRDRDGKYVCALDGGGRELVADRVAANDWETFEVLALWPGNFALRTDKGLFVCAERGGGGELVANRPAMNEWEVFEAVVFDEELKRVWDEGTDEIGDMPEVYSMLQKIVYPSSVEIDESFKEKILEKRRKRRGSSNGKKPVPAEPAFSKENGNQSIVDANLISRKGLGRRLVLVLGVITPVGTAIIFSKSLLEAVQFLYDKISKVVDLFPGSKQKLATDILGRDLKHFHSQVGHSIKHNSAEIWSGSKHGADIGFPIPDEYLGKKCKVTFRFKIMRGTCLMGVDWYGGGLMRESELYSDRREVQKSNDWHIPNQKGLKAVLRLSPDSRILVLYGHIETLEDAKKL